MTRKELIRKLLLTNHLNVPERQSLRDQPIRISEAREVIIEELKKHRFFPPVTDTWDNTRFYNDGLVIEAARKAIHSSRAIIRSDDELGAKSNFK